MPLAQPGAQAPRKEPVYTDEEIAALAAYVASLGPGPAIPDEADYSTEGLSDEEREAAIVRGGQIFLTNCTACHNFDGSGGAMPRGGYAPKLRGVDRQAHLRGHAHRPAADADLLRRQPARPRRSATSSPTSSRSRTTPNYGGFGLGGLGPVSEGLVRLAGRHRRLVGFAVWIAAHTDALERRRRREA